MMKRLFAVLTAVVLIAAVFTACGTAKSVDLKSLMDDINNNYGLTDLKVIEDTDGLHRYFQIEEEDVSRFAAELSTAATHYSEVIIIEGTDQTAAENIKTQLEAHLRSQLSNAKSYDAEQVAMIEACEVKQSGNIVYLVIGDSHEEIVAAIEAAVN